MVLEPLRYVSRVAGFTAVFFRRTTPQITNPGGLWDESANFYPRFGGTPHHRAHEWRWPRAGKIKFSHLQFDTTVYDWQGAQITLIGFPTLAAGDLQPLDEIGGAGEQHAPAVFDKSEAERCCKMALAPARWPEQQ